MAWAESEPLLAGWLVVSEEQTSALESIRAKSHSEYCQVAVIAALRLPGTSKQINWRFGRSGARQGQVKALPTDRQTP